MNKNLFDCMFLTKFFYFIDRNRLLIMANSNICIAHLSESNSGQCSEELKSLDKLNQIIPLDNGSSLKISQIIRIIYGQFDGNDNELFVCNSHETESVRKGQARENRNCRMPNEISTHVDKIRSSSKALSFDNYKSIFKEKGILIAVGKSK